MIAPILAAVAVLGAGVFYFTRDRTPLIDSGRVGKFVGQLHKGSLYRVFVRVTPDVLAPFVGYGRQLSLLEDIRGRVERFGFSPVILATQDPTDPNVFSTIGRWSLSSTELFDESPRVKVFAIQAVVDPPSALFEPPRDLPQLDAGLTKEEQDAIEYALATDDDPKHLSGLSWTLQPDHPVAASLLLAKSKLVEARMRSQATTSGERDRRNAHVQSLFGLAYDTIGWRVGTDPLAVGPIEHLKSATDELNPAVAQSFAKFHGVIENLGGQVSASRVWLVEQALRTAKGASGLSPTQAALASGAARALANTLEPDAVAKGGAQVTSPDAYAAGVALGGAFTEGRAIHEAALESARAQIPTLEGRADFDRGLSLGRGVALVEASFSDLYALASGNTPAEKASSFALETASARRRKLPVKDALFASLAERLPLPHHASIAAVKNAVSKMLENGHLLRLHPAELARDLDTPEPIAHVAQALVRELPGDIRIVDAQSMRILDPNGTPANEVQSTSSIAPDWKRAAVSSSPTSSLQLVYAQGRPTMSNVVSVDGARARIQAVRDGVKQGSVEALKAKESLDRAQKLLQRRKWIEWYKRVEGAGGWRNGGGVVSRKA